MNPWYRIVIYNRLFSSDDARNGCLLPKTYIGFSSGTKQILTFASLIINQPFSKGHKARKLMKLSEFKFDLPASLIANHPAENRDDSRLMVIHKDTGKIEFDVAVTTPDMMPKLAMVAKVLPW